MSHTKDHPLAQHDFSELNAGFLKLTEDGEGNKTLSTEPGGTYELPTATGEVLGGVLSGGDVNVGTDGTMIVPTAHTHSNMAALNAVPSPLRALPPVGSLLMWPSATGLPTETLLCNGAAISRTTYATLFAIIGTTYGAGDGSTTFNVPNFNGRFPMGTTSSSNVGATVAAGLPNIRGSVNTVTRFISSSGAFTLANEGSIPSLTGSKANYKTAVFSAANSNSIYGASSTVQPPAYRVYFLIVAV